MLSKKAKYALKALIYLAAETDGEPILISEIAEKENIPKKFLENILLELKKQGILESRKGKGGGYLLNKPADQISFGRIIRIMDGPIALLPCVSETAYRRCDECEDEHTCKIRMVIKVVRDQTAAILDNTTIADVLQGKVHGLNTQTGDQSIEAVSTRP